jgi:hypothetical protein
MEAGRVEPRVSSRTLFTVNCKLSTTLSLMPFFDIYWRAAGLPLSRLKGMITDAVPFSIVEVSLWAGTAATLLLAVSLLRPRGVLRNRRLRLAALLAGPVFLAALGLGQGAFPGSLAPTAWRTPLTEYLGTDSLGEEAFRAWVSERENSLGLALGTPESWESFLGLTENAALRVCDRELDTVLAALGLPGGRSVRAFKNMGPWTTTLGLVYGGPAFHDPFFGEIAIVSDRDMPAPHHWRLIAACHEAAHAKGFTREMDAEILTQLALMGQDDPRLRLLRDIHFLRKTGIKVAWPDSVLAEWARVRERRIETEARQPVVRTLRRWAVRTGLQNDAAKYGTRRAADSWNPHHPFFATLQSAAKKTTSPRHGTSEGLDDGP